MDEKVISAARDAYAESGPTLTLGAIVHEGVSHPEPLIRVPLAMMNRHGLIAGATGTGKTKTLQLLAEQLSTNGVPVLAADIKGDLSGMSTPGVEDDKIKIRASSVGQAWEAKGFPVTYYALGGQGTGIPLRV